MGALLLLWPVRQWQQQSGDAEDYLESVPLEGLCLLVDYMAAVILVLKKTCFESILRNVRQSWNLKV